MQPRIGSKREQGLENLRNSIKKGNFNLVGVIEASRSDYLCEFDMRHEPKAYWIFQERNLDLKFPNSRTYAVCDDCIKQYHPNLEGITLN